MILYDSALRYDSGLHYDESAPPPQTGAKRMRSYLSISFGKFSPAGFLAKAQLIGVKLNSTEGTAAFPDPWGDPAKYPTRVQLTQKIAEYEGLDADAKSGDRNKIATRNTAREELTVMFVNLAPYLQTTAGYDRATLGLTGYDLKKDTRTTPPESETMQAPQDLRLSHGKFSGMIMAGARRVPGSGSYETQFCEGDPAVEANWKHATALAGSTHHEIPGLPVGKVIYVRMRAIFGKKGPGAWSDVAGIVVI